MKKKIYELWITMFILCLCFTTASAQKDKDKEREKQQPELLVNADMEKVSSVIIKGMTEAGYDLEEEGKHKLVFRKKVSGATGFLAGMLAGRDAQNPHQLLTFVLVKEDEGTLISASASILYPNKNNEGIPRKVDNKKIRKQLWANLDDIKELSEKK